MPPAVRNGWGQKYLSSTAGVWKSFRPERKKWNTLRKEGIIFKTLNNPVEIIADENDDVSKIRCIRMELGEPDDSGRRRPIEVPGSEFDIDVDCVIMALGTSPNPLIKATTKGLEINRKGGIVVNQDGLTSREGVYAGGDAVPALLPLFWRWVRERRPPGPLMKRSAEN